MKRAALEEQRTQAYEYQTHTRQWLLKLTKHPIPDIEVELLAMYHKLSGDMSCKKAKWDKRKMLLTPGGDDVLVWASPTSGRIRYGPEANFWPVRDDSLWPLNHERTYQPPQLPRDVWQCICNFLTPRALLVLREVSTKLRDIVCNEKASWWTTRRAQLLQRHPGLDLPTKMWLFYARWETLDTRRATYTDFSNFCVLTLPPFTQAFTKAGGDIREPSLAFYRNRATNRNGKHRVFTRVVGHAYIGVMSHFICLLETKSPTRYVLFWGNRWSASAWQGISWDHYAKYLLYDREVVSYLQHWECYKDLERKIIKVPE